MTYRALLWMLCFSLALVTGDSHAKTVHLTPIADSTVKSDHPDTSFPLEDLAPYQDGVTGQPGRIQLAYLQFALPPDIASISSAVLSVTQTTNNGVLSYYGYGLLDHITQPDPDAYTWNNAPANNPADLVVESDHRYDPASAVYVAYFAVSRLDPVGQVYADELDTTGLNWLNQDTDNLVTFMLHRRQVLSLVSTLASLENPTYPCSELTLVYTSNGQGLTVALTETGQDTTVAEENQTQDNYYLSLTGIPAYDVTITISPGLNTTVQPDQVIFTPQNWSEPVEIVVTAVDDQVKQTALYSSYINHTVVSADPYYHEYPIAPLEVLITDNDFVCGDMGFLVEDLNQDCYVDVADLAVFLSAWLTCTDPAYPLACDIDEP